MTPTIALAIVCAILAGICAWLWWRVRRLKDYTDKIATLAVNTANNLTLLMAALHAAGTVAKSSDEPETRH